MVIGAGLAGLGAAAALRDLGCRAIVLEAADRIGGRAWTAYPEALRGVWFDMGAVWLHGAEHNPLVPIAESFGDKLLRSDELRSERTFIGSRLATEAELADYDGAWRRFEAKADELLASPETDLPLTEVAKRLPDDPWAVTIETWEGQVICTVDGDKFSLRDWRRNALSGSNRVPDGGIGAFVQRRLGAGLDIRLATQATRVRWNGAGGRVVVETPSGSITAGACVMTASTGVLASGAIAFEPALPAQVQACLHALPMGLAVKVALRAVGDDRLDLPSYCSVDRQITHSGEPFMPLQCWPHGRDYVQGWIGGGKAWQLARDGEAAAIDFTLSQLRALFGSRVDKLFAGGGNVVTHWDQNPFVRGSYSYVAPGNADARLKLAEPLADGHLVFAGEACHDGLAGTVAGAWLSGQQAARVVAAALKRA